MMYRRQIYTLVASRGSALSVILPAAAQTVVPADPSSGMLQEIIVTAQKRAQSESDVGLSITAIGAAELQEHRVDDPFEVAKLVPGLSVSQVGTATTTTYTLRGIGFNSAAL